MKLQPAYIISEEITKRLNGRKLKDVKGDEGKEIRELVWKLCGQIAYNVDQLIKNPEKMVIYDRDKSMKYQGL